jgi:asparagine synthase (glutamine-hydrolysing)
MCGIAGVYSWNMGAPAHEENVARMSSHLARRGPDGEGFFSIPGVALGHRRLSIIDLSERGRQPIANEDETVWLTFNGEIYNYRELRRDLERGGHRFKSDSDSEVLVHLYEDFRDDLPKFLNSLRGMFAFAVWDQTRRRLVLARDRVGIKPLYYHVGNDFVAFASNLDALTACPGVPRRIDWTSLYEYLLLLTVPGPHTIFRDIGSLTPGAALIVEPDSVRELTYWSLNPDPDDLLSDAGEVNEAVEAVVGDAVRSHLVADVEVGSFLSGGIDSGLVTALAASANSNPVKTFCAAFPGESVNEGQWAREASERLGTNHAEFSLTSGFLDGIEEIVEAMDQPLALTSAASLFHLSRMAREKVKVVLTGDGGDELFAGYNRHRPYPSPARAVAWLPEGARPVVGKIGQAALSAWSGGGSSFLGKAYGLSRALARDEAELYVPRIYYLAPQNALALLPPEASREVETDRYLSRVRKLFARCNYRDPLSRMLYVDVATSLADEMLAKVDRMTMAWGLEARVPLLDHHVVELSIRIPGSLKRNGHQGKLPLRALAGRHLGAETGARAKHGFNSPLETWLKEDATTRRRFEECWPSVVRSNAFDERALLSFKKRFGVDENCRAVNLFTLLVFGLWSEQRGLQLS